MAVRRGKIVPIEQPKGGRNVTRWNTDTGVLYVRVEEAWVDVPCPELQAYPNLISPFVDAFNSVYTASTLSVLRSHVRSMRSGFFRFLAFRKETVDFNLDNLSPQFIGQFKEYLDSRNARVVHFSKINQPSSDTLAVGTRLQYAKALLRTLQYLSLEKCIELQRHLNTFENILYYENAHKKVRGVQRLDLLHFQSIVKAVQVEIRLQVDSYFAAQEMLAEGRIRLPKLQRKHFKPNPFARDRGLLLAKVETILDREGFVNVKYLRNQTYGHASTPNTYRAFAPHYDDLVVHLLNFALLTAANLTPLLNLKFNDIIKSPRLGSEGYKLWLYKARGSADTQSIGVSAGPSLEEYRVDTSLQAGLRVSIELLDLWTHRLRHMDSSLRHHVFVGLKIRGGRKDQFGVLNNRSSALIMHLINRFCDRHKLRRFSFQSIRPTILDEIEGRVSDYRVTQELAHHSTPDTTERHYLKGYARQSYRGRLAQRMEQRSRFHFNNGKSDPRLLQGQDHAAATPGFYCLDPYASPIAGENEGRLCAAYGHCPACPLAAVDIESPTNVALYEALNDAFYRGAKLMEARSYYEKFGEAHQMLQACLSEVQEDVAIKAGSYSFCLPAVE